MQRLAIVAGMLFAVALALPATAAWAHADYDRSTPNKDEVVQTPPMRIDAFFTQEIVREEGTFSLIVFDETETTQVSTGTGELDDADRTHMFAEFPIALGPGKYVVRWSTLSADDRDADSGGFCFFVQVDPTQDQQLACSALEVSQPTEAPATGAEATATSPAGGETPAATPQATAGDESDDDGGTSTGVVIGAIIAAIAVAAVIAAGGWYLMRRGQS
jgi:methionine-rich copper-binding protein CopC